MSLRNGKVIIHRIGTILRAKSAVVLIGPEVRADGIHFQSLRYISTTLAAYVGETVTLRFDPRDMAEIRVFHEGKFLCRALCAELAGETVPLREILRARNRRRREVRRVLRDTL